MCVAAHAYAQFYCPTIVPEQQSINVLSAGFVDNGLRQQLSVLLVL